jgi:hypothetical protein
MTSFLTASANRMVAGQLTNASSAPSANLSGCP